MDATPAKRFTARRHRKLDWNDTSLLARRGVIGLCRAFLCAYSLRDLDGPFVEFACTKCEREGSLGVTG
jgi:hypothetical protein